MTVETSTRPGWPKRKAGRACLAVAVLGCGAGLIAGCTSSSTSNANKAPKPPGTAAAASASPKASGTPSAAACVHIVSMRSSLISLTHIKVSATSARQLATDLANIQSQLSALKGENLGSFSTQANELTAEINKIRLDAAELSSNPTKATKALTADLKTLKTKAGPMIVEMKKVCHVKPAS